MSRQGPPKHQNKFAWKPNLGIKINETEPGGRFRPLAEIGGVCQRCKDQIEWKRKYGKYKPLTEPAKWDPEEVEAEKKVLEEALKNCRERDRRRLLRAMNKEKPKGNQTETQSVQEGKVEGLFSAISLGEYAEASRDNENNGDGDLKMWATWPQNVVARAANLQCNALSWPRSATP
ncbi:hypothetical protein KSS87_009451 [Heliosperma pusillum]|nr:hypothetical protein KSS87_009451 [Heliosperma pusillum]